MDRVPYHRPRGPADIEARITFLTTEAGGRSGPAASGYRPHHDFGVPGEFNDAQHEYPDDDWVQPGQQARALLWLLDPERQAGRLHVGFRFTVHEGRKVVATGEILHVLNAVLRRGV